MDEQTEADMHYDTVIALTVELHRILSTMPDPTFEVKSALADVRQFFKRQGREHQLRD